MNIEEFRDHCLTVKGATESFPFGENVLVFKVMDKMFTYIDLEPKDDNLRASMKCDVERGTDLRDKFNGISQGAHTRSFMWNSVYLESDVPDSLIKELIDHSVDEVIKKLPKKKQEEYNSSL